MCRWIAYSGPPIPIDSLLFKPSNSLIRQSFSARYSTHPTNADGFGLGWYAALPKPGLFRDTRPAWNDGNLVSLAEQIESRLFFAHVRAATGTAISRQNCHPFRHDRWLFMHNGQIGGYGRLRRELDRMITAEFYPHRVGTTDSEAIFYLALVNGLGRDPGPALARSVAQIETLMAAAEIEPPFHMTAVIADGETITALRYSSDRNAPTLYYAQGSAVSVEDSDVKFAPGQGAVLVVSEPLDTSDLEWHEVPEGHLLQARRGEVRITPFAADDRPPA